MHSSLPSYRIITSRAHTPNMELRKYGKPLVDAEYRRIRDLWIITVSAKYGKEELSKYMIELYKYEAEELPGCV
ncbi:unnamed protein product [Strongylus vulgaris]|uniref:Uncharacterized protein n=1 Tax=Strongylus vulgaris TaxID=40348 RepID=A0A3P7LMV7_STRVU|nr:unnamed protein product [Strongylus vulgaris]